MKKPSANKQSFFTSQIKNTSKRNIPYYDIIKNQIKLPSKRIKLFVRILMPYKACHSKQTKAIKVELKHLVLFKHAVKVFICINDYQVFY